MARDAGGAVVIAAPGEPERVAASLRHHGLKARVTSDWAGATAGGVAVLQLDVAAGLRRPGLLLLPVGQLQRSQPAASLLVPAEDLRIGDVVVHEDHGVARLTGLRALDGDQPEERVALAFADGA